MARSFILAAALALAAPAHALCTSEGQPQPRAVLERFLNADCEDCWRAAAAPAAAAGTLALDWVLPGARGEDSPLAAVALPEAAERLAALQGLPPARSTSVASTRRGPAPRLRIAQGDAFNDYLGVSLSLRQARGTPWQAWLLLVEQLPAGVEGSPVARNLVRAVFRPDWSRPAPGPLAETRSMRIAEGARPERLRLVALLQDGHGHMRAIVQVGCSG